jgi:hypothetical protein
MRSSTTWRSSATGNHAQLGHCCADGDRGEQVDRASGADSVADVAQQPRADQRGGSREVVEQQRRGEARHVASNQAQYGPPYLPAVGDGQVAVHASTDR